MHKYIMTTMLCLFGIVLFSSYMIVNKKVQSKEQSFVVTKTQDINVKTAKQIVKQYNPEKQYYWKFKIQKTYHSNGMRIYTTTDTLSRELKLEDK